MDTFPDIENYQDKIERKKKQNECRHPNWILLKFPYNFTCAKYVMLHSEFHIEWTSRS